VPCSVISTIAYRLNSSVYVRPFPVAVVIFYLVMAFHSLNPVSGFSRPPYGAGKMAELLAMIITHP
jgi:hypothetical protein